MAIGEVRASGGLETQPIQDRSSSITAQATYGLGEAVNSLAKAGMGYLNANTDLAAVYDRRAMASENLRLDTQFLQYQADRAKEYSTFSRDRSANPAGLTRDYDAQLAASNEAFLQTVPERFREEYRAKLEEDRVTRVGSAFVSELQLLDTADTAALNQGLNSLASGVRGGAASLEDAQARWEEMVSKTALPDATKQEFILNGKNTIQGMSFGKEIDTISRGYGAVTANATGDDVVAAGLLPQERAILNGIATNEASGYDVWNGGTTFTGYEDHPAATQSAPGESTAAGRYQFILGTWRLAAASYEQAYGVKVPNFSPEWQDRVALHWAEVQFDKYHTRGQGGGKTFRQILETGIPEELLMIRDVLGKPRSQNPNDLEWQGLGIMTDQEFLGVMLGEQGLAGGGTGAADAPNIWTDPRYADMSLDAKMTYANQAAEAVDQQRREQAATATLQRKSFLDQVYNAGVEGNPAVLNALRMSSYWDGEAQAKENTGREVYSATQRGIAGVERSIAQGAPLSRNQAGAFAQYFGKDNFQGIAEGKPESYARLRDAVNVARILPEGINDVFSMAIANPQTQEQALNFLASLHAGDPAILRRSGFSDKEISQVELFKNLAANRATAEAAMADFNKINENEDLLRDPAKVQKDAEETFKKSYENPSQIVEKFSGWFNPVTNTKLNPNVENVLYADARKAYELGYRLYNNAEAADAYMTTYLEKTWGVSYITMPNAYALQEGMLTRFPPEKFYAGSDGTVNFIYKAIDSFAIAKGHAPGNLGLIADATTEEDVRSGRLPTYRVVGMDENGAPMLIEGRFGGETIQAQQDEIVNAEAQRKASLTAIRTAEQKRAEVNQTLRDAQLTGNQAMVDLSTSQLPEVDRAVKAAQTAAVEQGYINPTVSIDEGVAKLVSITSGAEPALARQLKFLSSKNRKAGLSAPDAAAMAEVISSELGMSMTDAELAVKKYLEQN